MKQWAIIALALLAAVASQAQETPCSWNVSLSGGYMMPNNMKYSQYSSPTYGLGAAVLWRPEGNSYWQRFWNYPSFGVKAMYTRIPNAVAGNWFGLEGVIVNPFGGRWEWNWGVGFSFYTKPHGVTGDTNNIFIGSVLNCLIDLGIGYRLSDAATLSLRLLHTSNGMLRRPNLGLNYLQLDLGWKFNNNVSYRNDGSYVSEEMEKEREWSVALSGGAVMSRDSSMDGYYPCYDVSLYYQHYVNPVFAFGGAIDLWYNGSNREIIMSDESEYRLPLYLSGMGCVELFWGPISLKVGMGLVVAASCQVTIPIYERVGAYYNFGRNYLGVALNAHAGRIEFIEWTYGRRFF